MSLIDKENEKAVEKGSSKKWGLLKQRCNGIEIASGGRGGSAVEDLQQSQRTLRHCPPSSGYCCEILDSTSNFVFLLSRQSLVPNQILPTDSMLPKPLSYGSDTTWSSSAQAELDEELAFFATVSEDTSSSMLSYRTGSSETTPNIHESLSAANALPNQEVNKQACMDCLREKKAADCMICAEKCPKYCDSLCKLEVKEKPVKRVLSVAGPRYRKDPERLIPRIVHQVSLECVPTQVCQGG